MQEQSSTTLWRVISASTRGAAHVRLGLPNQDARMSWATRGENGSTAVLAVADGHGGARHFRSEIGAKLAAETATSLFKQRVARGSSTFLSEGPAAITPVLQEVVLAWQRAVTVHASEHPITDAEWALLAEEAQPDEARRAIEANVTLAYGTTLLATVATEQHVVYVQLGDGDILYVDDAGQTSRPLPPDPRLIGNQTTSLCMPDAWREFRVEIQQAPLPALILLSSDGYANAFRSETDFLQIGPDYLEMLRQRGAAALSAELSEILGDASTSGSGDDITLGMVFREEAAAAVIAAGGAAVAEGSPEHRVAVLEERMVDAKKLHQAELQRVEARLSAEKQRANRATVVMMLALAIALGLAIPVLKGFYDSRVKHTTTTTTSGDDAHGKPGVETKKPDVDGGKRPGKGDKSSTKDKSADSEPDRPVPAGDNSGVTGVETSTPRPAQRTLVLKVSARGTTHNVTLRPGLDIKAQDIGLETKEFGTSPIAHVTEAKDGDGAHQIVNESKKKWKYSEPGSAEEKALAPKAAVSLRPGLVLKFGDGAKGIVG